MATCPFLSSFSNACACPKAISGAADSPASHTAWECRWLCTCKLSCTCSDCVTKHIEPHVRRLHVEDPPPVQRM